ncbi:MAG TPA: cupin domain-containing protein [Methanocellaceae archaeon]|jgi:mannose-6-phosphate isomerase-like protein (cupin superfamily)
MIHNHSNIFSYVTKDHSTIWELFHPVSSPVKGVSMAEALVEPGRDTEMHRHQLSQEIYYILEGEGEMRLGNEKFNVKRYDAILIPPDTLHCVKNIGKSALRMLCVCAPPYSHEDTLLEPDIR